MFLVFWSFEEFSISYQHLSLIHLTKLREIANISTRALIVSIVALVWKYRQLQNQVFAVVLFFSLSNSPDIHACTQTYAPLEKCHSCIVIYSVFVRPPLSTTICSCSERFTQFLFKTQSNIKIVNPLCNYSLFNNEKS